jgi:hypothetical protein
MRFTRPGQFAILRDFKSPFTEGLNSSVIQKFIACAHANPEWFVDHRTLCKDNAALTETLSLTIRSNTYAAW